MALIQYTYRLDITIDSKLTMFVGATATVISRSVAHLPEIVIEIDTAEKAGMLDTLDEYMSDLGFVRV